MPRSPISNSVSLTSATRPRWLFVDGSSQLGGHQIMALRWLEELRHQQRVEPVLMARQNTALLSMAQQASHATTTLPASSSSRFHRVLAPLKGWRDAFCLVIAVIKWRPAICISVEGCLLSQAWLTCVLRLMGCRVLIYVPLVEPSQLMGFGRGRLRDWLVRHVYAHVPQGWITLTQAQAIQFRDWAGVRTPVFHLPNTVSTEIEQAAIQTSAHSARAPIRVLILGRYDEHQKGLDLLLDFLETQENLPGITFSVIGGGPYGAIMQQRLERSPRLQCMLMLHPWSASLDVLRQHDVLLLPSRYEGVPLVMLEAMAAGVPVIASHLPGTQAFLPNSCLFPVGDLSRAMQLIAHVSSPARRQEIIERNRKVFQAQASGKAFGAAVHGLTNALLQWPLVERSQVQPSSQHDASRDAAQSPSTDIRWLASPDDGR